MTLACEEGHQLEAHKVIFDGSTPQTNTHTHWSELDDFIFHPKYFGILDLLKSWKSREEREIVKQNFENWEEKEKFDMKILWNKKRKRNVF